MERPSWEVIADALRGANRAEHPATVVVLARKLLETEPDFGVAWMQLGEALGVLSNYDEAELAFQSALKYCRQSYLVYTCMGHMYERRGDYDAAVRSYRIALDLMPHDADRYTYVGRTLQKQGKLAEAEELHRAATECREGCIDEAYYFRGLALRCLGRLDEARECFEKAIQLDPDYRVAKEALTDVHSAISLLPSGPCENPYANALSGKSAPQTAGIHRQSMVAPEPSTSHPSRKFIENALTDARAADHPATVVVLARKLLQIAPEDSIAWLQLGSALGYLSNYDEAERAFQNALKYYRKSGQYLVYTCMGHTRERRGDYEAAVRSYRVALDLMPHDADMYTFVGITLQEQGELVEAEELLRAGTKRKKGRIDEAYYNLGFVLSGQGRLQEASECFEKAVELHADYCDAKEALADARAAIDYQKSFE
jgi:tetratricopeptide (TPR) repeat protein